ncbi:hypothetical protein A0H81_14103 [Grifola frondosa]|uniref:Uncharacterized protein n=1 Tax=Grifola frondosa TaxID=5627 RepID=A0A1C7LSV1_GRIFR|nr:hypothetical protein A0H81_14103 [Grifola frondosa]
MKRNILNPHLVSGIQVALAATSINRVCIILPISGVQFLPESTWRMRSQISSTCEIVCAFQCRRWHRFDFRSGYQAYYCAFILHSFSELPLSLPIEMRLSSLTACTSASEQVGQIEMPYSRSIVERHAHSERTFCVIQHLPSQRMVMAKWWRFWDKITPTTTLTVLGVFPCNAPPILHTLAQTGHCVKLRDAGCCFQQMPDNNVFSGCLPVPVMWVYLAWPTASHHSSASVQSLRNSFNI